MGQVLYRKYRSRSLGEIVGQDHITTTLGNALKQGRVAHAYLLTGPRGVGKTSIARILAREINGLPYSEEPHLDIIEIDAASNRRIDEMRELRERVHIAPSSAKYKVYIIDEVHMLTKEAFNALLKTLEEPPAHVVFILATTEAHKLPETIISRTQRYSFRPVPTKQVIAHLKKIAKAERLSIDDDALHLIAEHGEGSFRDSISLLDQASSVQEHVSLADVERLLGKAPREEISALLESIDNQDAPAALATLQSLYQQGYEPATISVQLGTALRSRLASLSAERSGTVLRLLRSLLDVPASHAPRQLLEITVLETVLQPIPGTAAASPARPQPAKKPADVSPENKQASPKPDTVPVAASASPVAKVSTQPATSSTPPTSHKPVPPAALMPSPTPTSGTQTPNDLPLQSAADRDIMATPPSSTATETDNSSATAPVSELWQQALARIKQTHNTLYGIARMAQPSLQGDTLQLALTFAFHQKRLNEPRNRAVIAKVIDELRGIPTAIEFIIAAREPSTPATDTSHVSAISTVFGSAEAIDL